eukprot:6206191-Pleurochrysis_carterae.AAC.1
MVAWTNKFDNLNRFIEKNRRLPSKKSDEKETELAGWFDAQNEAHKLIVSAQPEQAHYSAMADLDAKD